MNFDKPPAETSADRTLHIGEQIRGAAFDASYDTTSPRFDNGLAGKLSAEELLLREDGTPIKIEYVVVTPYDGSPVEQETMKHLSIRSKDGWQYDVVYNLRTGEGEVTEAVPPEAEFEPAPQDLERAA